jgi:hypothetical protein
MLRIKKVEQRHYGQVWAGRSLPEIIPLTLPFGKARRNPVTFQKTPG